MHFRGTRTAFGLALGVALALPGTALGAGMSVSGPAAVAENATKATYTVQCGDTPNPVPLAPPVPNTGPLTVTVADGPAPAATAGSDYGTHTQTLPHQCSFATPTFTFDVPITNDSSDEPDERFTVTVEGPLAAEGQVKQSVTTRITDDDVPEASIVSIVRVLEGDPAAPAAQLGVTLSQAPVEQVTIGYATEESSALAGSDFTAVSGQLVIPAGQQSGTISVPIVDDAAVEKVEAFYVNLTSGANATVNPLKRQAGVAVFDNDKPPVPALSLPKGVTVREGASGTVNALFTVSLSSAATERVQVAWKTADFTAGLADYARGSGTLVFEKGQTSKTISVNVKGDRRDEPDEAFVVVLEKPAGATLGAAKSFGVIVDDDGPAMAIGRPKLVRKRALVLNLGCPASADLCKGRLKAVAGKVRLGTVTFELAKGETRKLKLKLSRKGKAALRKRARRVKFTAAATDKSGAKRLTVRTFRVKRIR